MIPVSEPDLGSLEREYLLAAFDSGWISSRGDFIDRAEASLREVSGAPYAAVCNNGTTALHLALLAAGVGPGQEVILPSLTYVATLNAVYYVGAEPVIVDVDPDTWCIDPASARAAVTPRTAAIIGVDLYGHPADYTALRRLADDHGLTLIADAAESIGATLDGRPAGSLADITTFSFFGNKVVTSGEGGAVACLSGDAHARVLQLRNQGNHPTERYRHEVLGYNYRMTNLSAAILTAQLERVDELTASRRRVMATYDAALSDNPAIRPQRVAPNVTRSPWLCSVRVLGVTADERDALIGLLQAGGVETRPVFHPVQSMPYVPDPHRFDTPNALAIAREGISLPTYPSLQDSEIRRVAALLEDSIRHATARERR